MQEIKTFKQSELVLKVNGVYDTRALDLCAWEPFIDRLCGDRTYQKEAIKASVIYLASGQYKSLQDLAEYNYALNVALRDKYSSLDDFVAALQMREKVYATIDLATGTGKSYVIYGIAQIALGIGLVKRVLVLCPSLTIERGLTEKFERLSGDAGLKALIPESATHKNPSITNANKTVEAGEICIENIHAVYETTGSSIDDSFMWKGQDTLVLNDEAHHIFNKMADGDTSIKQWKKFLLSDKFGFQYVLGFTGTAYIEDEYFPDVIYRYSLRQAIQDRVVKNVDYVREDESQGNNERFQKIYQNHRDNIERYPLIKPLSILITRDIKRAKALYSEFVDFLSKQENKTPQEVETKVLIVTSAREHKANISRLKYVDDKTDTIEWIISVSMLSEGWDVKNVFQIVPWEDRAFNSRLLIAQVLGRGLRIPDAYQSPQPKVVVFNHKAWSSKIKRLVDEVLEIEARISKLFEEFEQREWEGKTLKLGEDEYTQNALPPRKTIEDIVRLSMKKRGNYGEEMIETNVHKVLSAFTPLLRKNKKSVSSKSVANDMFDISTKVLTKQSTSVGMLRQDRTVFLTNNWEQEILDGEQKEIISEVLEDESLPKSSSKEIDYCLFKTPVTTVITASKPERRFVEMLCKRENADLLTAWIKSRDRGFYEIEYTCRYGSGDSKSRRYRHDKFNPDFFLKATKDNMTYFLVIEIKDDNDDCEENKAKYKYAVQHFAELNGRLERQGIPERYIFHFLSPNAYDVFFQHLRDGTVLEGQGRFRCALENLLEDTQPMP